MQRQRHGIYPGNIAVGTPVRAPHLSSPPASGRLAERAESELQRALRESERTAAAEASRATTSASTTYSSQDVEKLKGDIAVATNSLKVFAQVLDGCVALRPPSPSSVANELSEQCRAMQPRLIELISNAEDEGLLASAIHLNDELTKEMERYDLLAKAAAGDVASRARLAAPATATRAHTAESLLSELDDLMRASTAATTTSQSSANPFGDVSPTTSVAEPSSASSSNPFAAGPTAPRPIVHFPSPPSQSPSTPTDPIFADDRRRPPRPLPEARAADEPRRVRARRLAADARARRPLAFAHRRPLRGFKPRRRLDREIAAVAPTFVVGEARARRRVRFQKSRRAQPSHIHARARARPHFARRRRDARCAPTKRAPSRPRSPTPRCARSTRTASKTPIFLSERLRAVRDSRRARAAARAVPVRRGHDRAPSRAVLGDAVDEPAGAGACSRGRATIAASWTRRSARCAARTDDDGFAGAYGARRRPRAREDEAIASGRGGGGVPARDDLQGHGATRGGDRAVRARADGGSVDVVRVRGIVRARCRRRGEGVRVGESGGEHSGDVPVVGVERRRVRGANVERRDVRAENGRIAAAVADAGRAVANTARRSRARRRTRTRTTWAFRRARARASERARERDGTTRNCKRPPSAAEALASTPRIPWEAPS